MLKTSLLLILALTPSLSPFLVNYSIHKEEDKPIEISSTNDFSSIKKYDHLKDRQDLFQNLKESLKLKNQSIIVEKEKLDQKLWGNLYFTLISKEYQQNLNMLYKLGAINFLKKEINFVQRSWQNWIWVESYWYWAGHWRLHFENNFIKEYAKALSTGGDLASILADAMGQHHMAIAPQALSAILSLGGILWDKIPRLTIHFWLIIVIFIQPW